MTTPTAMRRPLRMRQVHLDFHTNGGIEGIGSAFDADAFGDAFAAAHVDCVNVFAKCHHGYSYHPTKVGKMHPHLSFDLLRAQFDALHKRGINAALYTTSTWDELAATEHPEWRIVAPEGGSPRERTHPNGDGWAFLDWGTPYMDYLLAQLDEQMELFPDADGIWMDIAFQIPSISAARQARMNAEGLDWTNPADQDRFGDLIAQEFFDRVTQTVRRHDPTMPLYFNAGHIRRGRRDHYLQHYTHLDLESLPTAGWGYDHFPLSARYAEPLGLPFWGMTGKFHFHWGEVGGYKKPEALVYECGAMLAHGAGCSVGDHLHPTARIDASTMRVIAPAYAWVKAREDWCRDTINMAEIGLLSVESLEPTPLGKRPPKSNAADEGAVRVLLENRLTFDVLDTESDFAPYRLLVLPDQVRLSGALLDKVKAYLAGGGRVFLTGESGLGDSGGYALDVGARSEGVSPMSGGDYGLPVPDLQAEGVSDPLFMYRPSQRLVVTDGTSLGDVHDPYMDRTARHFSGHVNAPSRPEVNGYAFGVEKGPVTLLAHPIFTAYRQVGAMAMLEIAGAAIRRALGRPPMIEAGLPRAGRATLRRLPDGGAVLHLLHATPALRGNLHGGPVEPIQDLVTLSDIEVEVDAGFLPVAVRLVPDGTDLPFTVAGTRVSFTVPRMRGHGMVVIEAKAGRRGA
jgi:hypothetical protein